MHRILLRYEIWRSVFRINCLQSTHTITLQGTIQSSIVLTNTAYLTVSNASTMYPTKKKDEKAKKAKSV